MKPHIELLPKNLLKLKTKPTLRLASYGICFAVLFCCGIFAYQMIGNSESAKAGHKRKFHISLFGGGSKGEIGAAVEADVTTTEDSLYIEFITVDQNEIRSAVLNISDFGNGKEQEIQQAKTFTVHSSSVNGGNYRVALALKNIPEKIFLVAKVSLLNKNIESATEVNSKFSFDQKTNSVTLYR